MTRELRTSGDEELKLLHTLLEHMPERWVSTTKVPQYDEHGDIRGLVVISRDITETKLAHDQVEAGKRRLEQDLVVAGETQAALFPSEYPEVVGSGLRLLFAHHHQFSHSLGGDYFTLVPFGPGRVGLFICDVMGHGVQSALVAAMIHAQFHEVARDDPPPDVLLGGLNERLHRLISQGGNVVFATALYMVVDLNRLNLGFALAGHPDPILARRRSRQARFMGSAGAPRGPALGLFTDPTYTTQELRIEAGQSVLMFTDGLVERASPSHELYGMPRLLATVQDGHEEPAEDMLRRILDDVGRFACGEPAEDDVCLLAVEVVPMESAAGAF